MNEDQADLEFGWSQQARDHFAWEPEWEKGVFIWDLKCSSTDCQHRVIVTGSYAIDWDIEEDHLGAHKVWRSFYAPNSFSEAPPIFRIKNTVPQEITKTITQAFNLFWIDEASCLNKIRQCVEELLTFKRVPRFRSKDGNRKSLPLHSRIEIFEDKNPEAGEALMALKWLGNEGSHASRRAAAITRGSVLEAFGILEHVLELVFESRTSKISKAVKTINKKRGL